MHLAASSTVVTRSSTALRAGYVPDGLTEAEWEAAKATRAKAAEDRKKKFANKTFEVSLLFTCAMSIEALNCCHWPHARVAC
jgi:hypothetical protein